MQPCLFDLGLIHFVFASFAPVVVSCHDGLPTDNTSWEVSATLPAAGVILADGILAVSAWTFDLLARSVLGRVFGEDADSHVDILLLVLLASHALQFDEGA